MADNFSIFQGWQVKTSISDHLTARRRGGGIFVPLFAEQTEKTNDELREMTGNCCDSIDLTVFFFLLFLVFHRTPVVQTTRRSRRWRSRRCKLFSWMSSLVWIDFFSLIGV